MDGYEMLVREFDALKEELKGLKADVLLLIQERDEARAAEARALEENLKMWAYYQEEEYKARQEGRQSPALEALTKVGEAFTRLGENISEGCRND